MPLCPDFFYSVVRPHMTLTPDLVRKRHRALKSVGERWCLDFATKEIRRKPPTGWATVRQLLWRDRDTIWEFYVWLRHRQALPDAILSPSQIDGDGLPMKGFPRKFALAGGWTIPQDDLKYLKDGPLASEDRHEILVPASQGVSRFFDLFKQVAPIVTVASGAVAIATNWATVVSFAAWARSAF